MTRRLHESHSFNPRAHAGRDLNTGQWGDFSSEVSTHAPTRGATLIPLPFASVTEVSTHAPTWGATCLRAARRAPARRFNPRAHAGRDDGVLWGFVVRFRFQPTRPRGARRVAAIEKSLERIVSTHAPTRGATRRPTWPCSRRSGFNPRAHAGRDTPDRRALPGHRSVSTHAPTRGATRQPGCSHPPHRGFNPRAHAGRDPDGDGDVAAMVVSTHAPTRGATARPAPRSYSPPCFNPRAHAGRDGKSWCGSGWKRCFNPRAHAGRDQMHTCVQPYTTMFQPTRPRGARPAPQRLGRHRAAVSTHAPTRGATATPHPWP